MTSIFPSSLLGRNPTTRVNQLAIAWALLAPLLYFAVHGQFSFTRGATNTDEGIALGSVGMGGVTGDQTLARVFIYAAYAVVLYVCARYWEQIVEAARLCKPIAWLPLITVCSCLWSQMPMTSLRQGIYYTLDTLFAFFLVVSFSLEELMSLMMMLGTLICLFSFLMVSVFPQYGLVHLSEHSGVWQGIFSEKNDAAKNLAFLLTPVCNRNIFKPTHAAYGACVLLLIVMTRSVTALIAVAFYLAFLGTLHVIKKMSSKIAIFTLLTGGTAGFALAAIAAAFVGDIAKALGRDATLTGRTDIWPALWDSVLKQPLLGYGYAAFWTGLNGESGKVYLLVHWVFAYAHNGFLEILLQVGAVGLVMVVVALVQAIRNGFQCSLHAPNIGTDWLVGVLALTLVYNLDEGTILYPHSLVSIFFMIACIGLAIGAKRRDASALANDTADLQAELPAELAAEQQAVGVV